MAPLWSFLAPMDGLKILWSPPKEHPTHSHLAVDFPLPEAPLGV